MLSDLELPGSLEEGGEGVLGDGGLAGVDELEEAPHRGGLHPVEQEQGVGVGTPPQQAPQEARGGRQHHPVRLHLLPLAHQAHVREGRPPVQLPEGGLQVGAEVAPVQATHVASHPGNVATAL